MPTPLAQLTSHDEFIARHIGPSRRRPRPDARRPRRGLARRAARPDRAGVDPHRPPARPARRPARRPRSSPPCATLAGHERAPHQPHRHGLLPHHHARRHPAQRARGPRVVHGLHPVPGRDQPGPAGGAARTSRRWWPSSPGSPVTNASLLDEATAAAEAMAMARRLTQVPPATASSSTTTRIRRRSPCSPPAPSRSASRSSSAMSTTLDDGCFGALFSLPTSTGAIVDWRDAIERVHAAGGLAVVATDLLACVLTTPPGQLGADIAIGSAQRFGVPMMFGGPHAAFIAAQESAARALPGRIVGVSTDTAGRPALRLALQTREQHIRREKATSNICTAQVLLANIAGFYAAYHGPAGLRRIAERTQRMASIAADALRAAGLSLRHDTWFDTVHGRRRRRGGACIAAAQDEGSTSGRRRRPASASSFDETTTLDVVARAVAAFGAVVDRGRVDDGTRRPARRRPSHRRVPHPVGVQPLSHRARDAALPAPPRRRRPRARSHDDPARLVHDEAQRDHRDGVDDVARVRRPCTRSPRSTSRSGCAS